MKTRFALLAALSLAAAGGSALAKDNMLLLPVDKALADTQTQAALQGTMVRFGAPATRDWTDANTVTTRSWSRYNDTRAQTVDGRPLYLSDEQACYVAFRYTVADLAAKARAKNGQSVVEVVSYYQNKENNMPDRFECHAGAASAIVTLRGRVAGPGGN